MLYQECYNLAKFSNSTVYKYLKYKSIHSLSNRQMYKTNKKKKTERMKLIKYEINGNNKT